MLTEQFLLGKLVEEIGEVQIELGHLAQLAMKAFRFGTHSMVHPYERGDTRNNVMAMYDRFQAIQAELLDVETMFFILGLIDPALGKTLSEEDRTAYVNRVIATPGALRDFKHRCDRFLRSLDASVHVGAIAAPQRDRIKAELDALFVEGAMP